MTPFLRTVAEDILRRHGANLTKTAVVFPNKRAALFLNQHLLDVNGKPLFSPRYFTITDLFHSQSTLTPADRLRTVSLLYNVYRRFIPTDESLDHFWGWGETMLNDFDDIDKHMADPRQVFTNIRDLHAFDSIDYLSDSNRQLLKQFFAEFTDDHESRIKQRFILLWNQLADIYADFNSTLRQMNLAYEGALEKDVALRADNISWPLERYIFVGFNALTVTEQRLFESLRRQGKALFYWDFDRYYLDNPRQEAGRLIEKWLARFPNELDSRDDTLYNNFAQPKDITFVAASTENIQARYIRQWLQHNHRADDNTRTAIVLADEALLKNVIHHLPDELSGKTNITIGYPLAQTPAYSLADNFLDLHIHAYNVQEQVFMLPQTLRLLRHPYAHALSPHAVTLPDTLSDNHNFFPSPADLALDDNLRLLFQPVDNSLREVNGILLQRLSRILQTLGTTIEQNRKAELAANGIDPTTATPTYDEQLAQESIFQIYSITTRLFDLTQTGELDVEPHTMLRLLGQIAQQTTMPMHGEPAAGLQIMGTLETRNLDFDHLLILSCNDGNIPRGIISPSLIPYAIRHAHALPTADSKTATYAYYFYRLLQRCPDITIAYNNSTEEGRSKQMSRFMLQLMVEADTPAVTLHHLRLTARQSPQRTTRGGIEKTPEIRDALRKIRRLSPSAINRYLRCPLQFYFSTVAGIRESDATSIDDSRLFGTIFHATAEKIHRHIQTADGTITGQAIDRLLNDPATIRRLVDSAFNEELFHSRNPHYDGLQLISREVITRYVRQLLKADRQLAPFRISSLEAEIYEDMTFTSADAPQTITIGGIVDRLDEINTPDGPVLRVIDYKTGNKRQALLSSVADIFDPENIDKHSDYYFQALLYSLLVRHSDTPCDHDGKTVRPLNPDRLPVRPALLFIQHDDSVSDPVLRLGTGANATPILDILDLETPFREQLHRLVSTILNPDIPFQPTTNDHHCDTCPYAKLCNSQPPRQD